MHKSDDVEVAPAGLRSYDNDNRTILELITSVEVVHKLNCVVPGI